MPDGCHFYNKSKAQEVLTAWACKLKHRYGIQAGGEGEAWSEVAELQVNPLVKGVPWYNWETVWKKSDGAPTEANHEEPWQYAFHFLDEDSNQAVNEKEFAFGVSFCESGE